MTNIKRPFLALLLSLIACVCSAQTTVPLVNHLPAPTIHVPCPQEINILTAAYNSLTQPPCPARWLFSLRTGHSLDGTTDVVYYIPENSKYAAVILLNACGKVIAEYDITHSGKGFIELSDLPCEICHYSLMINGSIVDSKAIAAKW